MITNENANEPSSIAVFAKTGTIQCYRNFSIDESQQMEHDGSVSDSVADRQPIEKRYTAEETFEAMEAILDYYEQPNEMNDYTQLTFVSKEKWRFIPEFEVDGVPFLGTGLYLLTSDTNRGVKSLRFEPIPVLPAKVETKTPKEKAAKLAEQSLRWEVRKSSMVKAGS